jgi:hypothetical protein
LAKKKSNNFRIEAGQSSNPSPIAAQDIPKARDEMVHVNLRYFEKKYECFSKWQKPELKAFSSWLGKMSNSTPSQVTSTTNTCHAHRGKTKPLPISISKEVQMYSFDVAKKARVHGFFTGNDLFLVWLDRNHEVLN